jgi:hypothetical protein
MVEAAEALELEPVAITIVDGGYTRTTTIGEEVAVKSNEKEGSMQWRR